MAVDTARLLSEVSKSVSTIRQTLESKILNGVKGNNPTNSDANAIKNLKNNIQKHSGITGSSTENVPDDVYTAFATMINNDLVSSKKITKFATNDFERTNQIANALKAGIKNEKTSISVNGTNYSIEYHIESFLGKGNSWANVSYKDNLENKKIILTWTNVGTQQGTQALAEYCSLLKDLDLELWKDFFKKVLTAGAKTWSVGNYGTQILNSINDKNYAKSFLKGLGVSTEQLSASKFGQFIKDNAVGGDVIVSSAKLLKTLEKKQTALKTAINKNEKDKTIESKLKEFAKTCNQLETNLGLKKSNFSIGEFIEPLDAINKKKNITITGTKFDDKVSNWGKKVTIKAGAGDDSINNHYSGENVKIFGENGNDTIDNSGKNVTINGGKGDDTVNNYGSEYGRTFSKDSNGDMVTIIGGVGDDHISNRYGSNVKIDGGTGNDIITSDSGSNVTIDGGKGNDEIYSSWTSNNTIIGGKGNDYIENHAPDVKVDGGTGDDYIVHWHGSNVTIVSGNGNDKIRNLGDDVTIIGGIGNDTISNEDVGNVMITGGKGKDLFVFYDSRYYGGDGNVITDYTSGQDKISVESEYNVHVDGKDVILTTYDAWYYPYEFVRIKNGKGKKITIIDRDGNETTKIYSSNSSSNVAELFEENNFITNDNLSEIVENNLTPTSLEKIETNFENLTQENNFITYSEK